MGKCNQCSKCSKAKCSKANRTPARLIHNQFINRKVFTRNGNTPNLIHGKDRQGQVLLKLSRLQ
jgi:hypothetical protein